MKACHHVVITARRILCPLRLTMIVALASAGCDRMWTYGVPGISSSLKDRGHFYYQVRDDERGILTQLSATLFMVELFVDWEVTNLADEPLEVASVAATVCDASGRVLALSPIKHEPTTVRCEGDASIAKGAKCHGDLALAPSSTPLFGYGDLKTITLEV